MSSIFTSREYNARIRNRVDYSNEDFSFFLNKVKKYHLKDFEHLNSLELLNLSKDERIYIPQGVLKRFSEKFDFSKVSSKQHVDLSVLMFLDNPVKKTEILRNVPYKENELEKLLKKTTDFSILNAISGYQPLTSKLIEQYQKKLNFNILAANGSLSEDVKLFVKKLRLEKKKDMPSSVKHFYMLGIINASEEQMPLFFKDKNLEYLLSELNNVPENFIFESFYSKMEKTEKKISINIKKPEDYKKVLSFYLVWSKIKKEENEKKTNAVTKILSKFTRFLELDTEIKIKSLTDLFKSGAFEQKEYVKALKKCGKIKIDTVKEKDVNTLTAYLKDFLPETPDKEEKILQLTSKVLNSLKDDNQTPNIKERKNNEPAV